MKARAAALARRHWAILVLLALAAALRGLVMAAYPPAFWFYGDSGAFIQNSLGSGLNPYDAGGLGYAVALKIFKVTGSFAVVAAVQHLTGLLIATATYAFLIRRVPVWLACLAVTPVLFDSLQVTLEHYLLGETLFSALAVAGVLLLIWPRSPGLAACAASGFAIMLSWFTRPSTVPVAVILLGYLLFRRVGWKRVLAFAAAFLIPYLTVQAWIGDRPSAFGGSYANRALYSRVAVFADCDRLKLTEAERRLCPPEPVGQRHDRPDWYGWNGPALEVPKDDNRILRDFALEAISQQPGEYARTVMRELTPHFVPGRHLGPEQTCLREKWSLPDTVQGAPVETACTPALAHENWQRKPADPATAPAATALSRALETYSQTVRTVPVVTSLAFVLVLIAAIRYRRGSRDAQDAVMLVLVTASLIIPPVLVAMYEARYGLPALPFAGMAAALAVRHLMTGAARDRA